MSNDRDLRDAFAELRELELRRTPRFHVAGPSQRPRLAWAAVFALLIVTVAFVYVRSRPAAVSQPPEISTWRAPTDFLLRTPGVDLTSSVPRIGKGDRS